MASLQSRISDLITAIGADIKQLQAGLAVSKYNNNLADEGSWGTAKVMGASVLPLWHTGGDTGKVRTGTKYKLKFRASKTGTGTGAPTIAIKIGPNADGTDTTRCLFTMGATTAVADEMEFECSVVFKQPGSTAIVRGMARMIKRLNTATGWGPTPCQTIIPAESAQFNVDTGDQYIYAHVFLGTSVTATVQMVEAELINMNP